MNPFLQEIFEQPKAVKDTASYHYSQSGRNVFRSISDLWNTGVYRRMVFTGMGSSYFISESAACLLNSYGIDACAINSGELLHYRKAMLGSDALLVCISQSGESYEVVKLLESIGTDIKVVAVTNEPESTLARKAEHVLLCKAGTEEMTSTKTFITCWQCILMLVYALAGRIVEQSLWEEIATDIEAVLSSATSWSGKALEVLGDSQYIQLIGRGPVYAAVCQSRLMFMEAAHAPASALLGGEFRHGPLEMVHEGFVTVLFSHSLSATHGIMMGLADELIRFGAKVILITDQECNADDKDLLSISVPCRHEDAFAMLSVIPMQLMINSWACGKGMVPGDFSHGAKVTSRE